MSYVYFIHNSVDNRFYIGQTKNLEKRFKKHVKDLETGRHHSSYLQSFYDKYKGVVKFSYSVYDQDEDSEYIDFLEEELIEKYYGPQIFNVSKKAAGGDIISSLPLEQYKALCEKQRQLIKQRMLDPEERKKHALPGEINPNYKDGSSEKISTPCSECGVIITRLRCHLEKSSLCRPCYYKLRDISGEKNPFFGKTHTKEFKEKLSEFHVELAKDKKAKGILGPNWEEIYAEGKYYCNMTEAARALGLSSASLVKFRVESNNWVYRSYYKKGSPKDIKNLRIPKSCWYIHTPEYPRILYKDYLLTCGLVDNTLRARLNNKNYPEYYFLEPPGEIEKEYQI